MPKKYNLDCEEMKHLYEKDFYSQSELARHFNVNTQVLRRHFKKCDIKARPAIRYNIPFKFLQLKIQSKRKEINEQHEKLKRCLKSCEFHSSKIDTLVNEKSKLLINLNKELKKTGLHS